MKTKQQELLNALKDYYDTCNNDEKAVFPEAVNSILKNMDEDPNKLQNDLMKNMPSLRNAKVVEKPKPNREPKLNNMKKPYFNDEKIIEILQNVNPKSIEYNTCLLHSKNFFSLSTRLHYLNAHTLNYEDLNIQLVDTDQIVMQPQGFVLVEVIEKAAFPFNVSGTLHNLEDFSTIGLSIITYRIETGKQGNIYVGLCNLSNVNISVQKNHPIARLEFRKHMY